MNCRKGRKKKSQSTALELIGPALIPPAALAAVPRTPAPIPPSGTPIGLATAVFDSSFPGRSPRNMAETANAGEEGAFSDPESSLFDYHLMEEAGYSSVPFGTWANNRKSYSDRDRVPTPPFVINSAQVGVTSQSGSMYHILDPEEQEPSEPDLYAVPTKKKAPDDQTDAKSLDRTQQDVRRAMQEVQNMPEESMRMAKNQQVLASLPGSSSGRGTMRTGWTNPTHKTRETHTRENFDDDNTDDDAAPALPPPLVSNTPESDLSLDHQSEVKEEAYVQLRRNTEFLPVAEGSSSGRLSTLQTSRGAAAASLETEVMRMQEENQQLHEEVLNLRKVAAAIKRGDKDGASTLLQSYHLEEIKGENEVLKNTVGRLNQELSQYQAKYRPLSNEDRSRLQGFPSQGPVPSWLINKRYLAPLFLAYDDRIKEKQDALRQCQQELEALRKRTEEIVRENQRYQLQGRGGGAVSMSDWQELQEQARLVLEENQVLIEQVEVQKAKVKDLSSTHVQEMGRLTKRLTVAETEKEEIDRELDNIRRKFKDIKYKHDQMLLNVGSHITMEEHITSVADLKRSVTEEKEQLEKEKEKMTNRLKALDEERKQQTLAAIEISTDNKQLRAEIKALHKVIRRLREKLLIMQKAIEQSENKEIITMNELANVIKIVEKTALERDTAFQVVKEQQRDCKDTVNRMVGNSVVMGKLEERLTMYKMKASAKLQTVAEKLKEQDDSFNRQRQEYEREIRYLRLLVREKEELIKGLEGDKKAVEEDMENIWQAASTENRLLKDMLGNSIHKLREHTSLKRVLDNDEELENLMFSE